MSILCTNLLENIFVGKFFRRYEVSAVVHAPGVREEWHRLGEAEDEASNVSLSLCGLVRTSELLDVLLDEGLLAVQSGDGADVGDGLDCELKLKTKIS